MMSLSYIFRAYWFLVAAFLAGFIFISPALAQDFPVPEPVAIEDSGDLGFLTGEENAPEPEIEELSSPADPVETVEADPDAGISRSIPALPVEEDPDDNIFFDAEALVPTGEMGTKGGPRKVNPRLQPGSALILVEKNHEAGSREAGLVAAERAVKLGRYAAALEMYNRLYQKSKRNPEVIMGRAMALQHLGRDDEAVLAYENLLELRPENVDAQINMMGLVGRRYPAVALQSLMELRENNLDHVGIVAQIAVIQANIGRYNDALQYLGIASSMEPNNAGHIFNIAVIADQAGNKKEAVRYYEQALEVDTIYGGGRSIPRESVFERLAHLR